MGIAAPMGPPASPGPTHLPPCRTPGRMLHDIGDRLLVVAVLVVCRLLFSAPISLPSFAPAADTDDVWRAGIMGGVGFPGTEEVLVADIMDEERWVPEHVRDHLRDLGFVLPLEAMEPHIRSWHAWMQTSRGRSTITGTQTGSGECTKCTGAQSAPRCAIVASGGCCF